MSPLVKSGHRGAVQQGPLSRLEHELLPESTMQKMTDVTISEIDDDQKREAALRAEELGETIFNILDEEKSYFVQLNAIAACLAVMLYGDDDAELLLRMFGDKVLRDLRVMAKIERERSR